MHLLILTFWTMEPILHIFMCVLEWPLQFKWLTSSKTYVFLTRTKTGHCDGLYSTQLKICVVLKLGHNLCFMILIQLQHWASLNADWTNIHVYHFAFFTSSIELICMPYLKPQLWPTCLTTWIAVLHPRLLQFTRAYNLTTWRDIAHIKSCSASLLGAVYLFQKEEGGRER